MSFVSVIIIFTEKFEISHFLTFIIFVGNSLFGLYFRKYGLSDFIIYRFSKLLSIFSLIVGSFFCLFLPFVLMRFYGFEESTLALFTLLLMFIPSFIVSIYFLITSFKNK
ncbi:hypothetical protein KK2020170_24100 [Flavobacterium okayamense]|uniref:Uncharacterized protein n=1 Tax=Flavobacterium okayamense TaxID=2830782 RepID=A0ABN6HZ54_9FLAO|nr:hypothetical protein KK2020170_24100 [Flavobacterium okayamense]